MQNFYPANVLSHIHDYIRAYGDLCRRDEGLFYWRFLYKCEGSWAGQNFCPAKFYLYSVVAFLCTLCCMMLYCGVSVALYIHTGHTLGTSLFSPPPSSTSQHGIFVNSPTTTGKVAFPSVFHAVGSGLYRSSSCGWGFPVCNIACVVWVWIGVGPCMFHPSIIVYTCKYASSVLSGCQDKRSRFLG